jgi:hypothetical protein
MAATKKATGTAAPKKAASTAAHPSYQGKLMQTPPPPCAYLRFELGVFMLLRIC